MDDLLRRCEDAEEVPAFASSIVLLALFLFFELVGDWGRLSGGWGNLVVFLKRVYGLQIGQFSRLNHIQCVMLASKSSAQSLG